MSINKFPCISPAKAERTLKYFFIIVNKINKKTVSNRIFKATIEDLFDKYINNVSVSIPCKLCRSVYNVKLKEYIEVKAEYCWNRVIYKQKPIPQDRICSFCEYKTNKQFVIFDRLNRSKLDHIDYRVIESHGTMEILINSIHFISPEGEKFKIKSRNGSEIAVSIERYK